MHLVFGFSQCVCTYLSELRSEVPEHSKLGLFKSSKTRKSPKCEMCNLIKVETAGNSPYIQRNQQVNAQKTDNKPSVIPEAENGSPPILPSELVEKKRFLMLSY